VNQEQLTCPLPLAATVRAAVGVNQHQRYVARAIDIPHEELASEIVVHVTLLTPG
jgi:hypothetical protein